MYIRERMPMTLEERMAAIEKKIAALAEGLAKVSPAMKDWRVTFGLSKDDPDFDEMIRLGQGYRKASDHDDHRVDS